MQLSIGQLGLLTAQPWIKQWHFLMIMDSMTTAGRTHHMTHAFCRQVYPPTKERAQKGHAQLLFPVSPFSKCSDPLGMERSWEHSLMESSLLGTQIFPNTQHGYKISPHLAPILRPREFLHQTSATLISSLVLKYVKFFLPCFHVFALVLFFS